MKNRSPLAVFIFSFLTLQIYYIYWLVVTKEEMNKKGSNIPTAWLIIIPFVSIWWLWKYSEAAEQTTGGKSSVVLSFILLWFFGSIGAAVLQNSFNKVGETMPSAASAPNSAPEAQVEQTPPTTPAV